MIRTISLLGVAALLSSSLLLAPMSAEATLGKPDRPDVSREDAVRIVLAEALRTQVPPSLALAVAKVESDFDTLAESPKGARGLMQIMPRVSELEFGVQADELWQAQLNAELGVGFLQKLYKQYGNRWDLALSHYNGGTLSGTAGDAAPKTYTADYVRKVLEWQHFYARRWPAWLENGMQLGDDWDRGPVKRPVVAETPVAATAPAPQDRPARPDVVQAVANFDVLDQLEQAVANRVAQRFGNPNSPAVVSPSVPVQAQALSAPKDLEARRSMLRLTLDDFGADFGADFGDDLGK